MDGSEGIGGDLTILDEDHVQGEDPRRGEA